MPPTAVDHYSPASSRLRPSCAVTREKDSEGSSLGRVGKWTTQGLEDKWGVVTDRVSPGGGGERGGTERKRVRD